MPSIPKVATVKRRLKTYRNPVLSLLQSALHETLQRREPMAMRLSTDHPAMQHFVAAMDARIAAPGAPVASLSVVGAVADCARLYAEMGWAEITGNTARRDELANEIKYGTCDPLWFESVTTYLAWRALGNSIPYIPWKSLTDFVFDLPQPAAAGPLVVAILGDWGTGMADARWLLGRLLAQKPDVILHLGDIYYSGTVSESAGNFLDVLSDAGVTVPVWTLSGNHDMYDGGIGYYGLLQQLHQPASYFCLRNTAWQILAMDTGYNDCNPLTLNSNMTKLADREPEWHLDKISNRAGRKTILLSHHQLFSPYGDGVGNDPVANTKAAVNPYLHQTFAPVLNQVSLWLWAHEHNLNVFQPYAGLQRGRCAGASAVPVRTDDDPYQVNDGLYTGAFGAPPALEPAAIPIAVNSDGEYFHSFAVLRLADSGPSYAEYYQLDSANYAQETLVFRESL